MTHPERSGLALPERIGGLAGVAANLSWSWNRNARALFRLLDAALWHLTRHNPIELLRRVDAARLAACAADPEFLRLYDAVAAAAARDATCAGTWFAASYPEFVNRPIAYFCAEFGLHASVTIYSGGLGVLAGDQCKAASDLGVPLVGVGLFYTKGYSDQRLRLDGWQEDAEERFDVAATPLQPVRGPKGDPCLATVRLSGRSVSIGAWRVMVGRVPIFLLDTDLAQNDPADRGLSHRLYAGGPDLRLRQEWVLGVGGVRVLRALGYDPAAWHAPDAQDPLLPPPQIGPAGVEPMGQPAVGRVVLCEIRVQEEDRHPTHHDAPSTDAHGAAGQTHRGEAGISLGPPHRLERRRGHVEPLLGILLPPVEPQSLVRVSLRIEQADADQWDAQVRSGLALVPREEPEASGINWHRGVQPELGAEVRDRPLDELGIRGGEPRAGGACFARGRGGDDVVEPQKLRVRRAGREPLRHHPPQQLDGIVLGAAPQRRIEHAEQRPRVAVPAPRQVGGNGAEPSDPLGEGGRASVGHGSSGLQAKAGRGGLGSAGGGERAMCPGFPKRHDCPFGSHRPPPPLDRPHHALGDRDR